MEQRLVRHPGSHHDRLGREQTGNPLNGVALAARGLPLDDAGERSPEQPRGSDQIERQREFLLAGDPGGFNVAPDPGDQFGIFEQPLRFVPHLLVGRLERLPGQFGEIVLERLLAGGVGRQLPLVGEPEELGLHVLEGNVRNLGDPRGEIAPLGFLPEIDFVVEEHLPAGGHSHPRPHSLSDRLHVEIEIRSGVGGGFVVIHKEASFPGSRWSASCRWSDRGVDFLGDAMVVVGVESVRDRKYGGRFQPGEPVSSPIRSESTSRSDSTAPIICWSVVAGNLER